MKVSFLEKIFVAILTIILAGIVIHAPMSIWLGTYLPEYSIYIKAWKEALLIMAACLAVIIVATRRLWLEIGRDRLLWLIGVYTALHLVTIPLFYEDATATAVGLAVDLRYVVFFSLVYVALKIAPIYKRRLLITAIIGSIVVVGFATLQLFLPPDILSYIGYGKDTIMPYLTVDKNPDYIRFNSTLRGPNPLGAYTVIVLGLLSAALVRKKLDLQNKKVAVFTTLFALCSLIGLWVSYSRSALVAGCVTVGIVIIATVARQLPRKAWIISCIIIFALAGGLIANRESSFVSNVLLHENTEGGSSVSSNEEHVSSLVYGIDRLIHQPLGAGIGSTGSASLYGNQQPTIIENQYLFIAHEVGWLGLVLFIALFSIVLLQLWQKRADWLSLGVFASGVGLGLIGVLQPVWVDDTVSIIWWGLAAIALAGKDVYGRKKTK